ncbi:hypothetical protein JHK82_046742 [Glycine max]|nr:hypothetical protein JHK86_046632 [Glycine max]KAG4942548.1 hypothetical protein JHK85_047194 [Glycine max]KAG5096888.1 hypothetical protein JHK82_046742 [Glycine max]KAG5101676.1 hypothetical protein JHK84_046645 [Glycine max]
MYSSPSQFDGNAAFSGGGFMPSQTTQGPDSSLVPSKNRDAQSLLPLTVKQIYDAVTLVGRVSNKTGRITDVTFVLDDGTGRIECSKWLHEAVDTNEAEAILPVTDFNEIASHFSDCIYVHLYNSRLRSSVPNQQHSSPIPPTIVYQAQAVPPTNQFSDQHINGQKGVTVEAMVLDFLHHPTNRLAIKNLIDEGAVYETIGDHNKSIING